MVMGRRVIVSANDSNAIVTFTIDSYGSALVKRAFGREGDRRRILRVFRLVRAKIFRDVPPYFLASINARENSVSKASGLRSVVVAM